MKTRLRLLALAALAALAGSAVASDAPHDDTRLVQPFCSDCHLLHGAPGPSLTAAATNANLCVTCHASQTNPTVMGWASGDQATATTGSSHSWSGAASALDKGAVPPTSPEMAGKLAGGTSLQCSTCHNQHSQANAPFDLTAPAAGAGRHFLQVANRGGQLCIDCHAPWNQTSTAAGTYATTGTASFTLNGVTVTGAGTTWLGTVQPGWRIKALAHAASAWAYVKTVNSNTSITLVAPYTGVTAAGAAYVASKTLSHPVGDPMVASSLVHGTPLDANGVAQVPALFGSATGGSTLALQDTTKSFSGLNGRVIRFTSGTNRGQTRTITTTAPTQLGWTGALASAVTSGTTYQVDLDGNFSNNLPLVNAGAASFTTGSVACQTCHGVHFADSNAATFGDRPPTPVGTGDGKLLRRAPTATCDACHPGWLMHSSGNLGTKYGTWGAAFTCETCHQPHKTGNVFLVRDTIATPNSGNRDVDVRTIGGGVEAYGLANSTTPGTGPCETCHTQTRNGGEVTGATSTFGTGTAVTLSSTTGLATGWEVKRTADGPGAWTRIATVNTATTLTLSTAYRGTAGSGAWQAANPRFRNTGSGRGAAGTEHYVTACLGCHPHQNGFKGAGESNGAASCDGCHNDLTSRMTLASGGNTLGGRPILSRHQVTGFGSSDSNTTWAAPLNGVAAANRSCLNMCHGDHPHDLTSPVVATHEYNTYLDATSQASRGGTTRTNATRTRTDFENTPTNGGLCLSCHRFAGDAATPVQHPAVDKAAYSSSAHNYTSNTVGASTYTWTFTQHDGGTFQRNCTKCHAGNGDGSPNATALPMEAVHYSANPSLLAGNMSPAAAGNTVAEQVCFGCHGNGTVGLNRSGKNLYDEVTSAFGHRVATDAVHDTPSEAAATANNGKFSGANRHVNCADCHDPHQAQPVGSGARTGTITAYTAGATDYTTGTAAASRNGTAVTGSGTAWTAAMVGRAISWNSDVPTVWYGITAVGSATSLTISPAVPANKSGAYVIRGAVADTLADSAQTWTKNQFKGWTLRLVSGAQAGRASAIYGNGTTTGTQLLVKFPAAPAVGDRYIITPSGARVAPGSMPAGSPAMAGAWGVQPTFGTPITPPTWNDSGGCGAAGTANACEVIPTSYSPITSFTKASASPPPEAYVCLKCHSSFAYGTTLANFPASPSGQPNVPDGTGQAWSNSVGVAMRQSDIASDANPANVGHHAILARGRNQPMVASATLTSVRNPNWPAHTAGTVNVAAGGTSVTLNTGTWPVNLVPGWFIYLGNAAPANPSAGWYEVTGVTSDTVLTIDRGCAAPSTCSATSAYHLTAGLGNTFVPPWGPWSVLECSDCHRSSTITDPLGPHGSATKWMLRGADTQAFLGGLTNVANAFTQTTSPLDANNLCVNCHRKDVYGDFTEVATPGTVVAGSTYTFSRQNHPADKDNGSSVDYRTRWGIMCMNCHGGARQGGIHGQNLGIGNGGTTAASYSGRRLLAGSSWYAVTRSSTGTAGQCWTKGSSDAVDSCGHTHSGVAFQSGAANYDYDSTQGGGTP